MTPVAVLSRGDTATLKYARPAQQQQAIIHKGPGRATSSTRSLCSSFTARQKYLGHIYGIINHRRHAYVRLRVASVDAKTTSTSGSPSAIEHSLFPLSNGIELEVSRCTDERATSSAPPLVFVHGLYHAAWCWEENWMEWLATRGYCCYAVSLRGQGGSSLPPSYEDNLTGDDASATSSSTGGGWGQKAKQPAVAPATLQEHVEDLGEFLASLPGPAVLVGHSFGGCVAQAYLSAQQQGSSAEAEGGDEEAAQPLPELAGMVLLGAPCVGTLGRIREFIADVGLLVFAQLFWVLLQGGALRSREAMRTCWFSEHLDEDALGRYFQTASTTSKMMPVAPKALLSWDEPQPSVEALPPVLSLIGRSDITVRPFQAHAAVEFWGAQYQELEDVAHDVMLDTHWHKGAEALHAWLQATYTPAQQ